ncbi:ESX secretion-associated protein EspG [Nocardia huaxiensis]|uniref:ESX secretion-associated protein EspG n=1 Tax=Nocardia huaxiensis TaxID=2755382 RepID=A0A7D6VCQ3_9NOCA|nr:ESX secretion-associated protein EspG [Nocardia huaxiensis]QLY31853.1 ESX secretion-associated protein EspG [Nocardia huaxiensis]UFS95417.1 ESX secretion-associated protein EspG [Nocardia huaxiensis]
MTLTPIRYSWRLTDLEFMVLWEDARREEYPPAPFVFTTKIPTIREFARAKEITRRNLRDRYDGELYPLMETIAHPDIRVVVDAWDPADLDRPAGLVRLLAVRRGDLGCLVTELPGESHWYSGGFIITECTALELADVVAEAMPELPAGRLPQLVLATPADEENLDYSYERSAVRDSFAESAAERAAAFLRMPAERTGSITIQQGHSLFGPRGITSHRLTWRDLIDDGRYVIDDQTPPVAMPVDRKRLRLLLNNRIAAVVAAIRDERA